MTNIIVKCEENIGMIVLNNPLIHNALQDIDVEAIIQAFVRWEDQNLNAILITGTGKSFCSGLFLDDLENRSWDKNPITLICESIESCRYPVICALNGGAFGGSVEVALACDFRIANEALTLKIPAARFGIHYEPSGLKRALNVLGPRVTRKLFLLGVEITFDDILRTDFVDFWTAKDESVVQKGKELVNLISKNAPLAVSGMKKTINEILNESLNIESSKRRIEECFNSSDHKAALLARKEKKIVKFRGT